MPAKYSQSIRLYTLVAVSRVIGLPRRWRQWRQRDAQPLAGPQLMAS